jgi:hypothetical protein
MFDIVVACQGESGGISLNSLHLAARRNRPLETIAAASPKTPVVLEADRPGKVNERKKAADRKSGAYLSG